MHSILRNVLRIVPYRVHRRNLAILKMKSTMLYNTIHSWHIVLYKQICIWLDHLARSFSIGPPVKRFPPFILNPSGGTYKWLATLESMFKWLTTDTRHIATMDRGLLITAPRNCRNTWQKSYMQPRETGLAVGRGTVGETAENMDKCYDYKMSRGCHILKWNSI